MPAVSKKQQRFFGIVRAIQKGEMAPTTPETAKVAATMKKKDVKDFASTKHKGLPKKKLEEIHKQAHTPHEVPTGDLKKLVKKAVKRIDTDIDGDTDKNDKKKGELGEFIPGVGNKRLYSTTGTKTATEAKDFSQRDKIMKKAKPLHKHLYKTLHKKDMSGDVNETFTIDPKAHRQQQRAKKIRDRTKTGDEGSEIAKKKVKGPALFGETSYYKSDSKYQKKVSDSEKRHKEQDKRMKFGKFYDKAKSARDRLRPGEVKRYDKKLGKYVSNKD